MSEQWTQEGNEWHAPGAQRIRELTNGYLGKDTSSFYVYVDGDFLGVSRDLKSAKTRAEKLEFAPDRLNVLLAFDLPAFCALTPAERKTAWTKYRNQSPQELVVSKYEKMGQTKLTDAYNRLVAECEQRQMGDLAKPVARFPDEEAARKAVHDLEAAIRERIRTDLEKRNRANPPQSQIKLPEHPAGEEATEAQPKKTRKSPAKAEAKADAPAKPSGKPAASEAPKGTSPLPKTKTSALQAFLVSIEAREGTNKAKLAACLFDNFGKAVKLSEVCKHVYGKGTVIPAINAVISGVIAAIKKKQLAYQVKRTEDTVGLYPGGK